MALEHLTDEERAELAAKLRQSRAEFERDRAEVWRQIADLYRLTAEMRARRHLPWWAR